MGGGRSRPIWKKFTLAFFYPSLSIIGDTAVVFLAKTKSILGKTVKSGGS